MNKNLESNESLTELKKGSHVEVSLKNADGSYSKVLEFEPDYSFEQYEVSDQKDTVTLPLKYRIETYRPTTVNIIAPIALNKEFVRRLAESLGLFDSE